MEFGWVRSLDTTFVSVAMAGAGVPTVFDVFLWCKNSNFGRHMSL